MYCVSFDPRTLDAEAPYQVKFRAYDAAGNQTEIDETIYVDATPPQVSSTFIGQWVPAASEEVGSPYAWTLPISGTISDPASNSVPGSGVLEQTESGESTLFVTLVDQHGERVKDGSGRQGTGAGEQAAQLSNGVWSLDYRFAGLRPQGTYTIWVRGWDQVGNQVYAPVGTLRTDAQPPHVSLDTWELAQAITTTNIVLHGIAADVVAPADALAHYHFEEASGASTFHDSSYANNHATCTTCPAAGQAGQFGKAALFAAGQYLSLPAVANPISTTFSAAAWFQVSNLSSEHAILAQSGSQGRVWLSLNTAGKLQSGLGGSPLVGATTITPGSWHHAAVTFTPTQPPPSGGGVEGVLSLYLDGGLEASQAASLASSDGGLVVGMAGDLVSAPFEGKIDNLSIFARSLGSVDVYNLAQSGVAGVGSASIWVEAFPFTDTLGTPSWTPLALAQSGAGLSTWDYTLPSLGEGYYRLHLQSSDAFGNTSGQQRAWRGIIDTLAPRLPAFTGEHLGGGSAALTVFQFDIQDDFLDLSSLQLPCGDSISRLTYTYNPETTMLERVSGSCRVAGHVSGPVSLTACDLFGASGGAATHCTTGTITLPPGVNQSGVAILDPLDGEQIMHFADPIPVQGGAYAPDGIQQVALYANNVLVNTQTFDGIITDSAWSIDWQPVISGTYTLQAEMTDSLGANFTDSIQVTLGQGVIYALSVTVTGSGTVTSQPYGVDCTASGGACQVSFAQGTLVTLTATPVTGAAFIAWGGACSGTGLTCAVTMDQARSVTAEFNTGNGGGGGGSLYLPLVAK